VEEPVVRRNQPDFQDFALASPCALLLTQKTTKESSLNLARISEDFDPAFFENLE